MEHCLRIAREMRLDPGTVIHVITRWYEIITRNGGFNGKGKRGISASKAAKIRWARWHDEQQKKVTRIKAAQERAIRNEATEGGEHGND